MCEHTQDIIYYMKLFFNTFNSKNIENCEKNVKTRWMSFKKRIDRKNIKKIEKST